jgi:hypothetical protein
MEDAALCTSMMIGDCMVHGAWRVVHGACASHKALIDA